MPLVVNYTDNLETDNEVLATLVNLTGMPGVTFRFMSVDKFQFFPFFENSSKLDCLKFVVEKMRIEGMDTVSLILPGWELEELATLVGQLLRETDWSHHPTHVLTFVCDTPEMYNAINCYLQGSWHL